MIKSMTGYGRSSGDFSGGRVTFEIKSVNNRYFDCTVKTPRRFVCVEEKIKSFLKSNGVSRGKIDVFMDVKTPEREIESVTLNRDFAKAYIDELYRLRDEFSLKDDITVMSVAARSDLFTVEFPDEENEGIFNELEPVLSQALTAFLKTREIEGEKLKIDILNKLSSLKEMREKLAFRSEAMTAEYRERLEKKLRAVLSELDKQPDEARILTECAIFADKTAIDEELVRLSSHFDSFENMLEQEAPVGKNLDFLVQEINREINTSGSKISDTDGTKTVIEMKGTLEKIREQIQNIE